MRRDIGYAELAEAPKSPGVSENEPNPANKKRRSFCTVLVIGAELGRNCQDSLFAADPVPSVWKTGGQDEQDNSGRNNHRAGTDCGSSHLCALYAVSNMRSCLQ
jgi:hypothetical protein